MSGCKLIKQKWHTKAFRFTLKCKCWNWKTVTSTIRTILKNKGKSKLSAIKKSSATKITLSRSNVSEEMEKRLWIWINVEIEHNIPLGRAIIMIKAISIFNHIQNQREERAKILYLPEVSSINLKKEATSTTFESPKKQWVQILLLELFQ